ncbi:glutathione S-transferase-like [Anneissia japonica]|uniref:glutathione S-transferase-like n=1 Tax=Anneissia japonica TaxID=1529436 RepID=UPI0014259720|nr:glutathione S-transferase-like [Anneissia japonica]XP_033112200.1 glutathione S-transferase-like [Anneissia japonica]
MGYKLTYLPIQGRAEPIRLLLLDNGVDFEDELVTYADFPKIKATLPFRQVPVLYDGDLVCAQSNAILRYLARKHGLYGSNDLEAFKIDMFNDGVEDLRVAYTNMIYRNYAGKDEFVNDKCPVQLEILENLFKANNGGGAGGFAAGEKISFMDYNFYNLLDILLVLSPPILDKYAVLKGYHQRMSARPKIAARQATDAYKQLKINGNGKQ